MPNMWHSTQRVFTESDVKHVTQHTASLYWIRCQTCDTATQRVFTESDVKHATPDTHGVFTESDVKHATPPHSECLLNLMSNMWHLTHSECLLNQMSNMWHLTHSECLLNQMSNRRHTTQRVFTGSDHKQGFIKIPRTKYVSYSSGKHLLHRPLTRFTADRHSLASLTLSSSVIASPLILHSRSTISTLCTIFKPCSTVSPSNGIVWASPRKILEWIYYSHIFFHENIKQTHDVTPELEHLLRGWVIGATSLQSFSKIYVKK